MIQRPVAVGLKVCQNAILDAYTKNVSLVNCYRKLRFKSFPSPPQSLTVCAVLNDGLGEMELSVGISALVDWDESDELKNFSWVEKFVDPLKEKWFLISRNIRFQSPENISLLLRLLGSDYLAHTTLDIQERKK